MWSIHRWHENATEVISVSLTFLGGTWGGGWVLLKGANSMAISELATEMLWVALGSSISLLLCANGLENSL